jgi:hypothetical protein
MQLWSEASVSAPISDDGHAKQGPLDCDAREGPRVGPDFDSPFSEKNCKSIFE